MIDIVMPQTLNYLVAIGLEPVAQEIASTYEEINTDKLYYFKLTIQSDEHNH
jgi:hypothetical protein